jgi:hypothetical protein
MDEPILLRIPAVPEETVGLQRRLLSFANRSWLRTEEAGARRHVASAVERSTEVDRPHRLAAMPFLSCSFNAFAGRTRLQR